ncbi:MAG: NADH-ubiquinone oxidoreductase-F iron-sulfur binding region domain-containing protein [Candidatus Limnocylindrales bacterium]
MRILTADASTPSILLGRAAEEGVEPTLEGAEKQGAWRAWRRVISSMSADEIIRIVTQSGLRGRGGGAYPTGKKWSECAAQPSSVKYVVANGFEADPGAQLDRTLMERDPHAILEGLAIAAYAIGANQAFIVVKSSAATAARRLRDAIRAAEEQGFLGTGVLESSFDLHVEVREVQGAHVLGEETVLLRAIEDKRAQPDQRPPYPTERGLWEKPTVVNNVETLATVPWILAHGAAPFSKVGSASNPGTTLVQVGGSVKQPGIAEVPTGTTLKAIIKLAGGAKGSVKAVLVGGPAGGFLPPSELDVALDPIALKEKGASWGSGTILVADDRACIVDMAGLMTRYLNDEACGKTIPCRIGLRRLSEICDRITTGRPRPTDVRLAHDLASDTRDAALCGLEKQAPDPLMSGMRYFMPEFEDHIVRGICPAGVCQPLRVAAGAAR